MLWLYISDLPPQCCSLILLSLKTSLTFSKVLLSNPALISEAGFKRNQFPNFLEFPYLFQMNQSANWEYSQQEYTVTGTEIM